MPLSSATQSPQGESVSLGRGTELGMDFVLVIFTSSVVSNEDVLLSVFQDASVLAVKENRGTYQQHTLQRDI